MLGRKMSSSSASTGMLPVMITLMTGVLMRRTARIVALVPRSA